MKFDKIEEIFRKELNERRINPSENSWDRLETMLTIAEENKPKRRFSWMYMAASFLGFLLVVTYFINRNISFFEKDRVFVKEQKATQKPLENSTEKEVIIDLKSFENPISVAQVKKENRLKVVQNSIFDKISAPIKVDENLNSIAENASDIQNDNLKSTATKSDEVNVDKLLASVKFSSMNENQNSSIKVNVKSLLFQVDEVPKLTFREKAINTIAENYKNIQVAIANRNHQ